MILSGTPIQNDLQEFHAMVSFVNPGETRKNYGSHVVFVKAFFTLTHYISRRGARERR